MHEARMSCIPAAIERPNPSRNCASVQQRESEIEKAKLWVRVQVLLWSVSRCGQPKEIERKRARETNPQHFLSLLFPFCLPILHPHETQGLRAIQAFFRIIQLNFLLPFGSNSQTFYLFLVQHRHTHTHSFISKSTFATIQRNRMLNRYLDQAFGLRPS